MLKPDKILVIDSSPFNHRQQYPDTYTGFNTFKVTGFPSPGQARAFMRGIDKLLSCETFYQNSFVFEGARNGVKTFLQYNYEFFDPLLIKAMPLPDVLLSPSYWMLDEMNLQFRGVQYLPPPTDPRTFAAAREKNFSKDGRKFLHIVGHQAVADRNGTVDLLKALKYTKGNFTLTIKAQEPLNFQVDDKRVVFDYNAPADEAELYSGFDALILPRRYAGLCLPMNEALMSGLPVIMTNIEPNNRILPTKWLVKSSLKETLMTRVSIDVYSADHKSLARKIDWLCQVDIAKEKIDAFELGYNNYSFEALKERYDEVLR